MTLLPPGGSRLADGARRSSIAAFEAEAARLLAARHATAFGFARHALVEILAALGAEEGDEVLLSALNCKVVPLALLARGLKPVYVDVAAATLNLEAAQVAAAGGSGARAVLFQHTYGSPAGVLEVAAVAAARGIPLIEDCAHCLPIAGESPFPGATGRAAIFSNNLRKPLPAGSGGLAVTHDAALAARIVDRRDGYRRRSRGGELLLRAEAMAHRLLLRPRTYWPLYSLARLAQRRRRGGLAAEIEREVTARASSISATQARWGLAALRRLPADARHRRGLCGEYAEALRGLPGLSLPAGDDRYPLYFFPLLVPARRELLRRARRRLIELVAWPLDTPIYPVTDPRDLHRYRYEAGACPVAEDVARRIVGLPTDPRIGPRHRDAVIDLVRAHLEGR